MEINQFLIKLINIKNKQKSPIKEMLNVKKNIQNIFSLNEVKQRYTSLYNSLRVNSTSVSLEKNYYIKVIHLEAKRLLIKYLIINMVII